MIDPIYFHGHHQHDTTIEYPYQQKPPPPAWQAWKSILCQCFVTNQHIPTLDRPLLCSIGPMIHSECKFTWNPVPTMRGKSLRDIFSSIAAQRKFRTTPNFITDEFVRLANTCRLWLRVIYLDDITSDNNELNMAYYNGDLQCGKHSFAMPYQEKPPQWVWKVWQEVLQKSCLTWCRQTATWSILAPNPAMPDSLPRLGEQLTPPPDCFMPLRDMAAAVPPDYKQLLGEYDLPEDDDAVLAQALVEEGLPVETWRQLALCA